MCWKDWKDVFLYSLLPHIILNIFPNDQLMARHHTIISSKETFFMFNYKYVMHFMWQCGTLTFFLAIVAVTSGIMAFNGMQQHCMVQFINFNRLNISLRPIVTIWAFRSRREREESQQGALPLSLRLWHNWVLTLLHRILPTSEHLRPVPSPLSISCPSSFYRFFAPTMSQFVSVGLWPLWTGQGSS